MTGAAATRSGAWSGPPTRLDRAVAELGLTRSRAQAQELIQAGKVRIDGAVWAKAGARVPAGAIVAVDGSDHYVSRGAHKLLAALDAFGVRPAGRVALDLGASTGGFTQVLLESGASVVLAVDVGHGQLAPALRDDPRVRAVEGCNARDLTGESLAALTGVTAAPELVVGDLSFISLTLILPAIARVCASGGEAVLLIKPQFEVGRQGIREGVVVDPELVRGAVRGVLAAAVAAGFGVRGLIPSPITGAAGNREALVYLRLGEPSDPTEWEGWIRALVPDPTVRGADGVPRSLREAGER